MTSHADISRLPTQYPAAPEDLWLPVAAQPPTFGRRAFLGGALAAAISPALEACSERIPNVENVEKNPQDIEAFLKDTATALLNIGEEHNGGLRFRSEIQAPHYHTDRDVGAASVGMGFLALADKYPRDQRFLAAAERTAIWLTSVSQHDDKGNLYWPDYHDDEEVSDTAYTSFDDGTLGIGDFFWQLYERTHNEKHKKVALGTVEWTFSQAENVGTDTQPQYRWQWSNDPESSYFMGMGQGSAGIIHTLAAYYERTKDIDPSFAQQCKHYIDGGLRYMDVVRSVLGDNDGDYRALPETGVVGQEGDTAMNSGYLSGAAGGAFMYLKLHQVFGGEAYLEKANQLFQWLEDVPRTPEGAWRLMIDPQGGNNNALATGFEEGAAGIGWVYLQAYLLTGDERYLKQAGGAAEWLMGVGQKDQSGLYWPETVGEDASPTVHANLNNGAAGIGMFLHDMYQATRNEKWLKGSQAVTQWLTDSAVRKGNDVYWKDNGGEEGEDYARDPSWHWGTAGVAAYLARVVGGALDIPGQQPGLK